MTPEQAEKAKIRAKQELETFSIYLDQAIDDLGGVLTSPRSLFSSGNNISWRRSDRYTCCSRGIM